MQYIGVDIIEIERIRRAVERWGEAFLRRVFTPAEIEQYGEKTASLAVRFAAKEAILKALNACDRGISWRDIEILSEVRGKPLVRLCGRARQQASDLAIRDLSVSLSHSKNYAVAFAVGTAE